MTEQEILETIKKLRTYLSDPDAPISEAVECALYDLEELLK